VYISSWQTHLKATGRYLPYEITVLPATWHKWTCSARPTLTPASKLVLDLPTPEGWKAVGWVDLDYQAMLRPQTVVAISRSLVRHLNHYTTEPPSAQCVHRLLVKCSYRAVMCLIAAVTAWTRMGLLWRTKLLRRNETHSSNWLPSQAVFVAAYIPSFIDRRPFSFNSLLLHRVSKKLCKLIFCHNFAKFRPIVKIFGTKIAERTSFSEVYSFSTSPNLCQRTTMWNADVPNCYITL